MKKIIRLKILKTHLIIPSIIQITQLKIIIIFQHNKNCQTKITNFPKISKVYKDLLQPNNKIKQKIL